MSKFDLVGVKLRVNTNRSIYTKIPSRIYNKLLYKETLVSFIEKRTSTPNKINMR